MKFSLASIHASGPWLKVHQWSVSFFGITTPNILKSGGGIGDVTPVLDVVEPLYKMEYETLAVGNGLPITLPQYVDYGGELTITFFQDEPQSVFMFLLEEWVNNLHVGNAFKDLRASETVSRRIKVDKYNADESNPYKTSIYHVMPPPDLSFNGSGAIELMRNTITLPILKIERKHE